MRPRLSKAKRKQACSSQKKRESVAVKTLSQKERFITSLILQDCGGLVELFLNPRFISIEESLHVVKMELVSKIFVCDFIFCAFFENVCELHVQCYTLSSQEFGRVTVLIQEVFRTVKPYFCESVMTNATGFNKIFVACENVLYTCLHRNRVHCLYGPILNPR